MTALGSILAGGRVTAAMLQAVAPLAVIKGSDQTLASSTTLQADDALFVPVQANAGYLFFFYLDWEGSSGTNGGIQGAWAAPSGANLVYQTIRNNISGSTPALGTTYGAWPGTGTTNAWSSGGNGAHNLLAISGWGTLVTGSTPGNVAFWWTQSASSSTATVVHAGSVLALWQVQ